MSLPSFRFLPLAGLLLMLLAACGKPAAPAGGRAVPAPAPPAVSSAVESGAQPRDAALAALGRRIFFDPSLSASGRMSCASCHDPAHAYAPANALAVQRGGPRLDREGARAVPTLRYVLNRTPRWSHVVPFNPYERLVEGEEPPTGGFGWDGRFDTLHEQAGFPLLAANEMGNASAAEVVEKLRRAAYAEAFRVGFGAGVFDDAAQAYQDALLAIERFELGDASFHPYSSRYDAYLDGKAQLSEQERRGLVLFDDPQRGNCASCHIDRKGADGSHPLFTDYQFEALGVPRNPELRASRDPNYFDEGLCGPIRLDQAQETKYCGMFKTPTLRNVATRGAFFHNGRFHTLKEALEFYVRRDTDPQRWYPSVHGGVEKFDDLPAALRGNADVVDLPLTRKPGEAPVWNDAEIEDVMAFLRTLNDADAVEIAAAR